MAHVARRVLGAGLRHALGARPQCRKATGVPLQPAPHPSPRSPPPPLLLRAHALSTLRPSLGGAPDQHGTEAGEGGAAPQSRAGGAPGGRWYHLGWRYDRLLTRLRLIRDPDLRSMVSSALGVGSYGVLGATALGTLGVDLTPLTAAISVTGITVGFAARDVAANYISGLLLLVTEPFDRGDYVVLGRTADDLAGTVVKIDMRYLYLRPLDGGQLFLVPNSTVFTSVLRIAHTDEYTLSHPPGPDTADTDTDATVPAASLKNTARALPLAKPLGLDPPEDIALPEFVALADRAWAELSPIAEAVAPRRLPAVQALAGPSQRKIALWLAAHPRQRFASPEWRAYLDAKGGAVAWLPDTVAALAPSSGPVH